MALTVAIAFHGFNQSPKYGSVRPISAEQRPAALNQKDIEKIAHLARLEVSGQECAAYAADLSRILGLIEQMNAIATDHVAPMAQPETTPLRFRDDAVTQNGDPERLLALAPASAHGLYLVPRVIE